MPVTELTRGGGQVHGPDAVIMAAQRRRRRRWRGTAIGVVLVLGIGFGVFALIGGSHDGHGGTSASGSGFGPGPGPQAIKSTVLMYPVHAPVGAPVGSGLSMYVGNLSTGRLTQRKIPGLINCDCQQSLVSAVGSYLVYVNSGEATVAIPADLKGKPRLLGDTPFFVPAVAPDRVWVVFGANGQTGAGSPVTVWTRSVTGGPAGPAFQLPASMWLKGDTTGGLLLQNVFTSSLALWHRGGKLATLPDSANATLITSTAHVVVWESDCRSSVTVTSGAKVGVTSGCQWLRVYSASTGTLHSYRAPAGTAGWLLADSSSTLGPADSVSPASTLVAAQALTAGARQSVRLFVLPVGAASAAAARSVPTATGSMTAWSADGSWLFYQASGGHLWAYQVATGKTRQSTMPCCRYWAMAALPGSG